jgi:hypothetical protein
MRAADIRAPAPKVSFGVNWRTHGLGQEQPSMRVNYVTRRASQGGNADRGPN